MGCVFSRQDINDVHSDTFSVINVDDQVCDLGCLKIGVIYKSHYVQFSQFYGHFEILNRKTGY